jgi:hypothetical protein
MLLQCDFCGREFTGLLKIPCGFYIEKEQEQIYFIMPVNGDEYRNICFLCLGNQSGKEHTT